MAKRAMAIAAHPDDIEFMMAGTLLLLKNAGYEIHYMTISDGNCGSMNWDAETTARVRVEESKESARILGAQYHLPIGKDFEIFYTKEMLQKLTAVIRSVEPDIILTHSPTDYMEDHMITCRLTVTAAFVRGIPNYKAGDSTPTNVDCTIYHAMPHGLQDPLRRDVIPEMYVDVGSVFDTKQRALSAHKSQHEWLDSSQKMNSYLRFLEEIALLVGQRSGRFQYAEGWRRHLHYGFGRAEADPLKALGENYLMNETYKDSLSL